MNRWLKYGGIMPETINTAIAENFQNKYISGNGNITDAAGFHYYRIYLKSGNYKIKNIAITNRTRGFNYRIHLFTTDTTANPALISLIPSLTINNIYSYIINIPFDGYVTFSMASELELLEIEKL